MIDYLAFERACQHWITALGLTDWAIDIGSEPLPTPDDDRTVARTYINWTQRAARIVANCNHRWMPGATSCTVDPERVALHEVLHIVLNELGNVCANERSTDTVIADAAEHAAIRRLMRALPSARKEDT